MKEKYQKLIAQISTLNAEIRAIFDKVGDGDLTAEQYKTVTENNKKIEELEIQAKEILDQNDIKAKADQRASDDGKAVNRLGGTGQQPKARTPGESVLDDPEFDAWRKKVAPAGSSVSRAQFGNSPSVGLKTLITGASSTSGGALVVTDRTNIIDPGTFYRPLTVVDLITSGTTDSDLVEYVRQGTHTNNAAPVAEATATSDGSGAKPESAMVLAVVSEAVKTIAHWIPATRRALADASQLRTLIDTFLRYGLEEELENQIVNGSGSGENFTGILNTSGRSQQAYTTDILTTTRKARTLVRTKGRATPTGYLLHPEDWEAIDLLQDNEGRYFFGGPSALGQPRLWGLPVVESEALTPGVGIVADWRLAVLWRRMAAQILVSDSHLDFFTRNLIAILGEERAAFGVIRPAAFVEMDLTQ